jgi:hypothetical protein
MMRRTSQENSNHLINDLAVAAWGRLVDEAVAVSDGATRVVAEVD